MDSPFRADVLKGKVALLTGGGSGIDFSSRLQTQFGRHGAFGCNHGPPQESPRLRSLRSPVPRRLLSYLHTAFSAILYFTRQAIGIEGDVRKKEDAIRAVEETVKHFGKLSTFLLMQQLGIFLHLQKICPPMGFEQAAVDSITRSLALEWGTDYDIRVNGVAPGPIEDTPGISKLSPEEAQSKMKEYMPLFKLGEKWDIAMAALYLASNAGKYVNGTTMIVDGGLWLSRPRHIAKETVREVSRIVEKRSREVTSRPPTSKL
ncbi:hypothetical protein Syun_010791 [Stephania yunnanensis]|uniref:2,4-dienoyl-CoA reductase [(3E)-enoyl-CoA-producing] n=1 Tax=Stephania yunnanensis TaxID=152371 RepID=A0AAP0PQA2_9MAGN